MEWLKTKWVQFCAIVSGQDKNWDGKVDIKDKLIDAKQKTKS
tara:strand:- start:257 stop:382 length:126 start_codon:yes stop_codon:yes gene_type:complete